MTHVLDTNVVSALMRGDPRVVDRMNRLARPMSRCPYVKILLTGHEPLP